MMTTCPCPPAHLSISLLVSAPHRFRPQVREVCDWTELIGLGQYRRKLVHHAVGGALLLRLTSEELKVRCAWPWGGWQAC